MSDFECPVVRIESVTKHPNADSLSLTEVEGCPVIFRTEDFKVGDLAVYLPIESVIPEDREWVKQHAAHLKFKHGVHRLKAVRLRGIFSMGMLVPIGTLAAAVCEGTAVTPGDRARVAKEAKLGQDVSAELGVTKYEEPEDLAPAPREPKPRTLLQRLVAWLKHLLGIKKKVTPRPFPVYGVDHYRKSKGVLVPGEQVVVTEKIHGTNFACALIKGKLVVSSHRVVRKTEDETVYWRVARKFALDRILKYLPDHVVYGEIYGPGVQDMEYDVPMGELQLRVFDIYNIAEKRFLDERDFHHKCTLMGLPRTPVLYEGPYVPATVEALADGPSTIAKHFREGIVVKTAKQDHRGRIALKLVGETYLLRKGGTERH